MRVQFDLSGNKFQQSLKEEKMILNTRQLLALNDRGICLRRLHQYTEGKPEVYDGEYEEITTALHAALGENWKDYIEYAKLNSVKYGL